MKITPNFDNLINCYDLTKEKIISAKASFYYCELSELPRLSHTLSFGIPDYCYNHEYLYSCLTKIPDNIIATKDKNDLKNAIKAHREHRKLDYFEFWKNLVLDLLGKKNSKINRCVVYNKCQTYIEEVHLFDKKF